METRHCPLVLLASFGLVTTALAQDELTDVAVTGSQGSGTSAQRSAGTSASVIFTNVPGAPGSMVPGLGVPFDPGTGTTDFDRVYGSPNGNWILGCFADLATTDDELVIANGVVVAQEGTVAPWGTGTELVGTIDTKLGINDSGDFTYANNAGGSSVNDDFIVTNVGGVWGFSAQEGGAIPGLAGNTYDDILDSPVILADGTSGFSADGVDGTVTTTEDDLLILGTTVLMQEGVTVPTGQIGAEFIDNYDLSDFFVTPDGAHWLVQGDLTGASASDDVLIVDGAVVLQEDVVVPGSGFANPIDGNGIVGCFMDPGGNWYARGNNDTSETDWVVRNGAVIASTGAPAYTGTTELWDDSIFSDCFFLHVGNGVGDYVIGGVTDNADDLANGLLVLNGQAELCREGDPVDLDGNGAFDDDCFINTFGNDDAFLSDAGIFYMVVTVRDGAGSTLGQAFMSIDTSGTVGSNYCVATANSTGAPGAISASGSSTASANDLTLEAASCPPFQFGIFVTSLTQDMVPVGNGTLCLGGSIGRYSQPSQIQMIDAAGAFSLALDLTQTPQGIGSVAINAGETWNFQAWFRDTAAGGAGSNFTNAVSITFN